MMVGRWYVPVAALRHWYLPFGIYAFLNYFILLFLSIPFFKIFI